MLSRVVYWTNLSLITYLRSMFSHMFLIAPAGLLRCQLWLPSPVPSLQPIKLSTFTSHLILLQFIAVTKYLLGMQAVLITTRFFCGYVPAP